MNSALKRGERFGILCPPLDAHSPRVSAISDLLRACGIKVVVAEEKLGQFLSRPEALASARSAAEWARAERLSALCLFVRLDSKRDFARIEAFLAFLQGDGLVGGGAAPIRALFFSGPPPICDLVLARFPFVAGVCHGDETASRCLEILGLRENRLPASMAADLVYDDDRRAFGRELVAKNEWEAVSPVDRTGSPRFGLRGDGLLARLAQGKRRNLPPLMRADAFPWLPDRREALVLFERWTTRIAKGGYLDILSIDDTQLDGMAHGENRERRSDGEGPITGSPEEFEKFWALARPLLILGSSGNDDVVGMARMLEERIDIAWHALSFWWSSRLDGRGPHGVLQNLERHFQTLDFIAECGKPFEPDVSRHFSFHGADDTSFIVSGWLAACAAKERGLRDLVLQIPLKSANCTWGVNDLAKARALLQLARELEDGEFCVHVQPRTEFDFSAGDGAEAMAELAAVAALMDDIEPWDARSPGIIHIASPEAGSRLADPRRIEDAIRITRHALSERRRLRIEGLIDDMSRNATVLRRTSELLTDARSVIAAICAMIPGPFSPVGMYRILANGFLPLPGLSELRDEFPEAVRWKTGMVDGALKIIDDEGIILPSSIRLPLIVERMKSEGFPAGSH